MWLSERTQHSLRGRYLGTRSIKLGRRFSTPVPSLADTCMKGEVSTVCVCVSQMVKLRPAHYLQYLSLVKAKSISKLFRHHGDIGQGQVNLHTQ